MKNACTVNGYVFFFLYIKSPFYGIITLCEGGN
jgi:hypothetical protein